MVGRTANVALGALLLACPPATGCAAPDASVVTFNIENYPRSERQAHAALALVGSTGAPVVGLQEIRDPEHLRQAAQAQLGASWRFVTHEARGRSLRVGLLYDGSRVALEHAIAHDAVRVTPGGRPALEVLLLEPGGQRLRVFVVHLKAGAGYDDVRKRQMEALSAIVAAARAGSGAGERLVVLGDFNVIGALGELQMRHLARTTGLIWSSEHVPYTAMHHRDGRCAVSSLDHILSSEPLRAAPLGPCTAQPPGDRCPVFVDQVSDHCPVAGH